MSKKRFIKNLKVQSPCTEDWEEMSGNKKVRFCSHCDLKVNNLSGMTRTEAKQLVRDSDGRLCVRYVKDPKTQAPVFADKLYKITRQTGIAAGVLGASLAATSLTYAQGGVGHARVGEKESNVSKSATLNEQNSNKKLQKKTGRISGVITDAAGAVIPNTLVKIANKGFSKVVLSDEHGSYLLENIPVETYKITFNATGFTEEKMTSVEIRNNTSETINATLKPSIQFVTMGAIAVRTIITNPLINAIYNGKLKQVRSLIARGADVNEKDTGFNSQTALHTAVQENDLKIIHILLNAGADVNSLDEDGNTPLMSLNDQTNVEIIKLLVKYGTNLNFQDTDTKSTALINAATSENIKAIRVLIEAGANVNLRDSDGDSTLDLVTDEKIKQLLIAYGAEESSETE